MKRRAIAVACISLILNGAGFIIPTVATAAPSACTMRAWREGDIANSGTRDVNSDVWFDAFANYWNANCAPNYDPGSPGYNGGGGGDGGTGGPDGTPCTVCDRACTFGPPPCEFPS